MVYSPVCGLQNQNEDTRLTKSSDSTQIHPKTRRAKVMEQNPRMMVLKENDSGNMNIQDSDSFLTLMSR
jgi:hypothetical protein